MLACLWALIAVGTYARGKHSRDRNLRGGNRQVHTMSFSRRRILIINGKGGCGKTTIATNLAVAYADRGYGTALVDHDSQAASSDWAGLRTPARAPINLVPKHQRVNMYQTEAFRDRLPDSIVRVIIDTPSGARERNIDALIKRCDLILVPMLPSPLDVRAGARFIAELLTHRSFRAKPRPIGVVVNRAQASNPLQARLMHSLECLEVPCVASFTDSPLYGRAAEDGRGIIEVEAVDAAGEREQQQWTQLVQWIESQSDTQAMPKAAPPRQTSAAKQAQ